MSITYPHPTNHFEAEDLGTILVAPKSDYTKRPSIYVVLVNDEGLVATIQYRQDVGRIYPLPGGGVDKDEEGNYEKWEDALVREVREEIGCEITDITQLGSFGSYDNSTLRCFNSVICSARYAGETSLSMKQEDYEQGSKLVWVTKEELRNKLESLAGPVDARKDDRSRMTVSILGRCFFIEF